MSIIRVIRSGDYRASILDFAFVDTLVSTFGWSMITKDEPMTLRHLCFMTSGYMRAEAPGAAFAYNDFAINLLGRSLKLHFGGDGTNTDTTLTTAAASRITTPIGMQDGGGFTLRDNHGVGYSPRDWARVGWWVANQGDWNGTQLLPAAWFTDHFGVDVVAADLADSAGTDGAGDYLSVETFGSAFSKQDYPGFGVYSWLAWVNNLYAETGLRAWPGLPNDALLFLGHDGLRSLVILPTEQVVAAWVGTQGDAVVSITNAAGTWHTLAKRLYDAVTGAPSYAAEFPGASWTTATDAEAGMDTTELNTFTGATTKGVITRRGRLVRGWGDTSTAQDWSSGSKPMLAFLTAFAAVEA